jgi:hypothetical protein
MFLLRFHSTNSSWTLDPEMGWLEGDLRRLSDRGLPGSWRPHEPLICQTHALDHDSFDQARESKEIKYFS